MGNSVTRWLQFTGKLVKDDHVQKEGDYVNEYNLV
ncbi:hypothetical protein EGR_09285 [Echinococcus granulosus]|uniref:Uncharacterized protein n=1 Tax=Echinococcus granulosus TaxID=6210 RepID=W6U408_ECHGR|nr:hypothetical protein EGR_09285 [Echinococcus granulosus]EUB55843.1 hypothetical protein EGR_09285 [Echinococcus granulosus]